jgi:hypothetical protein
MVLHGSHQNKPPMLAFFYQHLFSGFVPAPHSVGGCSPDSEEHVSSPRLRKWWTAVVALIPLKGPNSNGKSLDIFGNHMCFIVFFHSFHIFPTEACILRARIAPFLTCPRPVSLLLGHRLGGNMSLNGGCSWQHMTKRKTQWGFVMGYVPTALSLDGNGLFHDIAISLALNGWYTETA